MRIFLVKTLNSSVSVLVVHIANFSLIAMLVPKKNFSRGIVGLHIEVVIFKTNF